MGWRDAFWLDGESAGAAGLRLQEPIRFSAPRPRYETAEIPGRSGLLQRFEGVFDNVTGTARCFALERGRVETALAAVNRWCFAAFGYRRLETEDEPEIYRLAVVTSGAETELRMRTLAPFTLTFDCKPQRYLKSGERAAALTASGARLANPGMESRPLITVYGAGAGTLTAGGRTVQLKSLDGWLTLDCDLQNAYKGTQNKNNTIFAPEFPVLPPGESAVTWTGGVTRVEIIPRWWVL